MHSASVGYRVTVFCGRWLHRVVLDMEFFLSRLLFFLARKDPEEQRFLLDYNRALGLRRTFPDRAGSLLEELVQRLDDCGLPTPWINGRKGRIYFHLALLATEENERLRLLAAALSFMPEHHQAREMRYLLHHDMSIPPAAGDPSP